MKKNKFNKALRHLKSTELDEKIQKLDESPTNSIGGVYALNKPGFRLSREKDPAKVFYPDADGNFPSGIPGTPGAPNYVRPAGYWDEGPGTTAANPYDTLFTADWSYSVQEENPRNTDTLIDPDTGYVLSDLPPDSRSFILGPLVDLYFHNHSNDNRTFVGYVQKDTREFVLLGSVLGRWGNDDAGNLISQDGFTTGRIWNGLESSFSASNSNFTFEMLQWFHDKLKAGKYVKRAAFFNSGGTPILSGTGGEGQPDGTVQGNSVGAGAGDASDNGDANVGAGTGGNPDIGSPQDDPNHGGPDDAGFPWFPWFPWLTPRKPKPGDPDYVPDPLDDPNQEPDMGGDPSDPDADGIQPGDELVDLGDGTQVALDPEQMAAFRAGGGQAAIKSGKSLNDVMTQGYKNQKGVKNRNNLRDLMSKPPGSHTPAEKKALLDAGLDDFVKGGKTQSPLGDLAMLALTYLGVKAGPAKVVQGASAALAVDTVRKLAKSEVSNSSENNLQMLGKLTQSIVTGEPREVKLDSRAKKNQINSVDDQEFERVLQIGTPPKADTNNAVNPTPGAKSDAVLTGGWADQGGVEVSYDPKEDSLTITSNKMLRSTSAGNYIQRDSDGKIVSFSDIPPLTPNQVQQGVARFGLEQPLKKIFGAVGALDGVPTSQRMNVFNQVSSAMINYAAQGTASNAVALRNALVQNGLAKPSEMERTGGGYGQVFSQTQYKGDEIPKKLRGIIDKKTSKNESFNANLTESRKRILREIKQPYKLPEQPKQKYKMNFKGKFTSQNTPDVTASKKSDDIVSAKNAAGQTWRTKDKYWSGYESTERMNVIYDHVGHGQLYWDTIVDENRNKKNMRDREIQEHLNLIEHKKAMKEIVEQQTLDAPKDPLFKKVAKRLKTEIDYPDKPSKNGYPDTPPPEMVNGFHPEYGKRYKYDKLDPHSAEAMPPTGNPEIDANVQKARKAKKLKESKNYKAGRKTLKQFSEETWSPIAGDRPTNSTAQTFAYSVQNFQTGQANTITVSGLGGVESVPSTVTVDYGFNETEVVSAPTFSQLGLQGYAKPLGFEVRRRTDLKNVNPQLDASQEFAQRVGADYMMNARVQQSIRQEVETDLAKIAAKFNSSLVGNMGQNIKLAVEAIMKGQQPPLVVPPDPQFTGMTHEQMVDETNKVNDRYNNLLAPLYKELDAAPFRRAAGLVAKINNLIQSQDKETNALYEKYSKDNQEYGDLLAKQSNEWSKFVNAIEDYRKEFNLKDRSTNYWNYDPSKMGREVAQIANNTSTIPILDYGTNIAKSIFANKPIIIPQSQIPQDHIDKLVQGISNSPGTLYQIPINTKEEPYSDSNFYELPNGEVRTHTAVTRARYGDNTMPVDYNDLGHFGTINPLAAAGQAQLQIVKPEDGEPYLVYTDHAYRNLTSTDSGEATDNPLVKSADFLVHTILGKSDPTKPNTGAMANYPPNIKGDVRKQIRVPYSQLPQRIRDHINYSGPKKRKKKEEEK